MNGLALVVWGFFFEILCLFSHTDESNDLFPLSFHLSAVGPLC
jgi:hypothetical protein